MGRQQKLWIGVALALVLAFVFNPRAGKHRDAWSENFRSLNPISGAFGIGGLTASMLKYRSLGVMSYTAFPAGEFGGRVATFGMLGVVVVVISDDELDIGREKAGR
jgi:hypothetical protein